ncbi:MAG TPA: cytochrome c biogenesis protein CcsA [Candidatus Deferrimicrobium sp.]|nr:cytochrome c biogenesis protein CcsA [Candidatus Deferrimicrobium sp.]
MAYLGDFFLYAATACALLSLIVYALAWRGKQELFGRARRFFVVTSTSLTLALAVLLYLILTHDFSVAYVHAYSSTDLPLGYLIATLWAGQEGTFLLWIFYVSVMGLLLIRAAGKFEAGAMVVVNLFVLSILSILIKKSPFEVLPVFRAEGAGLNPLLQDFWMTIHPPIMFVGFAGTVIPFCFAITALAERKYDTWAEAARKWTMFAWLALGVSLVMGGYWAYKTLGWGGFWAWDPVENSSFIPWIFLTAQVHSLFIKRQRRGMMRFSLFVVCLSFWSVLYGTFLTRSGVLGDFSVHSFVDLGINGFLIAGLFGFIGLGSFLLILRWSDIRPEPSYATVNSRSYLVTLGIVILFLGGVLTLLGTSAPLLTRLTDKPSNVGLPYYFATMTPIAISVLTLLALFPSFRWNHGISRPRLIIVGASVAALTVIVLLLSGITSNVMYLALFGAASWAIVSNGYVVISSLRTNTFQPGYLAHVGLAVGLVGAATSNGFERKQTVTLPRGQDIQAMGYTLTFADMIETAKGYNCHVNVVSGDRQFAALLPHEFPRNAEGVMKKPHVEKYLTYDLYISPVALEQPEGTDQGALKLLKGESAKVDKYEISFHDFELSSHGQEEMSGAAALLTITYDGKSEDIKPSLEVTGKEVKPVAASFDYGRGTIVIAGVRPDEGGVMLTVTGDFAVAPETGVAALTVEVSEKPLINLFWLGTITVFASGFLSMWERRKRKRAELLSEVAAGEAAAQPVP